MAMMRFGEGGIIRRFNQGDDPTRAFPLEPLFAPPRAACHRNALLNWRDYRGGRGSRRNLAIYIQQLSKISIESGRFAASHVQ